MKRRTLLFLSFLVLVSLTAGELQAASWEADGDRPATDKIFRAELFVDCDRGRTIGAALRRGRFFPQITIEFAGQCEEIVTIDRDHVTLRGRDGAVLLGAIDIPGATNVTIEDLTVGRSEIGPVGSAFGGINATNGAGVKIQNVLVEDVRARGIRVVGSSAEIRDTTVQRATLGDFVFRSAGLIFGGTIVGNDSPFGMSLVNSSASARFAEFRFEGNFFGLLVQLNSGLEHVEGRVFANNNSIVGILLAGQGIFSFGSIVEASGNGSFGILIDELSSLTPLIGAPGDGPGLIVADNDSVGIAATRLSTLELFDPTSIRGNGIGLQVDDSTLTMANTTIEGNGEDVVLSFATKASINGDGNVIGSPIACDGTVLLRGTASCSSAASAKRSLDPLRSGAIESARRLVAAEGF